MIISVVIPVYNSDCYIQECIDSIIQQSFDSLQIILVDDGSTDNSATLCDQYKQIDKRITVIHQSNQGSFLARKKGVEYATGDYITFIDSDDYYEPDYFTKCSEVLERFNPEVLITRSVRVTNNKRTEQIQKFKYGFYSNNDLIELVYPKMLSCSDSHYEMGLSASVCYKFYKNNLFKKVLFKIPQCFFHASIGEDAIVFYSAALEANSIYISEIAGYVYRQQSTSKTHSFNRNYSLEITKVFEYLLMLSKETKWNCRNQINNYVIEQSWYVCFNNLILSKEDYSQKRFCLLKYLNNPIVQSAMSANSKMTKDYIIKTWLMKNKKVLLIYIIFNLIAFLKK